MAVSSVNMLLSILFLSGALAACSEKSGLFITTPQEMKALSGSCLQIPCNFRDNAEAQTKFDGTRETFGAWIKNNIYLKSYPQNLIFNSSLTDNKYPMFIIGNLSQKNCTTLFSNLTTEYTNKYYFRIENWPFRATAICDLQITVQDSPPRPSIEISGVLKENEDVVITCSAFTPCPHSPPQLTWTLQQNPYIKMEKNRDGTFMTKIQEAITLSDKHDGNSITCSARYPVNEGKGMRTAEEGMTLSVSYAPKDTSVSITTAGGWVNLTCSSRANPPISRFTWFQKSTDGPVNVSDGDVHSIMATDRGIYFCMAFNNVGDQKSSVISLEEGENLKWEPVLGGIIGIIILICLIICFWRLKSTRPTSQQTQNQAGGELPAEESAKKAEDDNIHYGTIDFSKMRSSDLLQDSGRQQHTVYAQVTLSETANSSMQTADDPEYIYAQVRT